MSNLEPTDVGPAVGGDRSIAENDRAHGVTLLTAAHSEGLLTADERDRRLERARSAQVFDDLVPLTRDLVSLRQAGSVRYAPSTTDGTDQMIAIFSGTERSGVWQVRPRSFATAVFGGVELNMTEAVFEAKEVTIEVFCLFGGVTLKVPDGTRVNNHVAAVFGGVDQKLSPPAPDAPVVTIKGFAGFGGVEVRNPKRRRRNG